MSGLGALQEKISDKYYSSKGAERFERIATLGTSQYTPHRQAYEEQQTLNERAAELEAQQNADAAAAGTAGPQAMGVRPQEGGTAVAGVKPPATNATAQTYAIWNPLGSGKNIVPLRMDIGFVDTTSAAGNIALSLHDWGHQMRQRPQLA
mgnify:CR=1 FL=1